MVGTRDWLRRIKGAEGILNPDKERRFGNSIIVILHYETYNRSKCGLNINYYMMLIGSTVSNQRHNRTHGDNIQRKDINLQYIDPIDPIDPKINAI